MTQAKQVLVIGRLAAVNQRVVARLVERGHAAVGAAGEGTFAELDARGFALVAIGSGVDVETRAALEQRFAAQQPGVVLLDVYGPLAAEQVEAALRRGDGEPVILESLSLVDDREYQRVALTVREACRVQVDVHRHRGGPDPEVVAIAAVDVTAGTHLFTVARAFTGDGHMLVVRAGEDVEVRRLFAG